MDPRSMVTRRSDPEIWPFQNPGAHREVRRSEVAATRDGSAEESTVTGQSSGKRNTRRRENGTPVAVSEEESSKLVSTSSDIDLTECDAKRHKLVKCKDENGDSKVDIKGNYGNCYKPTDQSAQPSEVPKQDYIHVRARRGQATDSHSLAERARREKISERMKILQDLVPGCNKVIGKSLVLDEIINYIQSLQRQVEFLSMKLEVVNSRINSSMEEFPAKNFNPVHTFDNTNMTFASPAGREYTGEGSPQEWPPHMQVGTGFENVT